MTLGQKLKALLKESRMTQEDLAEQLEVSRQAVGKWVNDKGIPEVGKLVQISDLFDVSLDYLLKEDGTEKNVPSTAETGASRQVARNSGYYVSKEMLDGYLSYGRQRVTQITMGIGLFFLSNVFDCFGSDNRFLSMLYWLTMITGVCMIIWYFLQTRKYQEIRRKHLLFDEKVFTEFQERRESRRKKYAVMMIVGVAILLASPEMEGYIMSCFGRTVGHVLGWIADTIWPTLMIYAGMSMYNDSIIVKNAEHGTKEDG